MTVKDKNAACHCRIIKVDIAQLFLVKKKLVKSAKNCREMVQKKKELTKTMAAISFLLLHFGNYFL